MPFKFKKKSEGKINNEDIIYKEQYLLEIDFNNAWFTLI